jgi:hypothetical protein
MMNRRGFVRMAGGAMLVLPLSSLLVQACYGSSAPDGDEAAEPPTTSDSNAEYTTSIEDGHSHMFDIALTAFASPADIQGQTTIDDGHSHDVVVSAADLQSVESGQTKTVTTAVSEGHTHVLTLVKVD